MTYGRLAITEGAVSANIVPNAHMDAAVAKGDDSIAGFEVAIEDATITVGPREDFRAPMTLTVSCNRGTMLALGALLLEKGGPHPLQGLERVLELLRQADMATPVSGVGTYGELQRCLAAAFAEASRLLGAEYRALTSSAGEENAR